MKFGSLAALVLLFTMQSLQAQNKKEEAHQKGKEAIKIMDEGKIDESIKLLKEAQELDPDNFDYPYEIAYAHYLQKDYKGAIKILEKISSHKHVTDRLFQLMGNSYDLLGDSEKAFETYRQGLKKFPESGLIYLEMGNVHWGKKEYNEALPYYEKGIEVDPTFPSNYYRAAILYCSSTEEMWGLIYGEIFMNMERNSERTAEMSQYLFETYKNAIVFKDDTTVSTSFCQQSFIAVNDARDIKKMKLPYCMIYEPSMLIALALAPKNISLHSLDYVRQQFISIYYQQDRDKEYPNVLFDYQKKIQEAGHFEAYNHWILMKGDEGEFEKWQATNEQKWNDFVSWFLKNPLEIDKKHKFYSGQYQD